jgi:hypothetical protein
MDETQKLNAIRQRLYVVENTTLRCMQEQALQWLIADIREIIDAVE